MQRVVIGCLVFVAAFGIGSFLGYDASSRHPVGKALDGLRQSRRAVRPLVRDLPVGVVEMYGDWVSTDGTPVIRLTPTGVTDVANGQTYRYQVLRRVDNSSENRLIIKLSDVQHGSNLRNIISLRFSDDGWVSVQGYGGREDGEWGHIDESRPTAMYTLSRSHRFGN